MKFAVVSSILVTVVTAAATPTQQDAAAAVPSPVQDGITKDCKTYYKAKSGDSCSAIVDDYGVFTLKDFYKWNPDVGSNCESLLVGYYYCVGVAGTPSKCTVAHPSPTQPGSSCKCSKWYKVNRGDVCTNIEKKFNISNAEFHKLNSGLNKDCSNLQADVNVCVKA
ncbi:hypothetical protein NLG97_g5459 [Lecanicillium saksenae]|uniref:Uncharacterized protein n=1 Tax=Lecanicillium saksenae TaxID=468837 RepID=A0ACC1QVK8_9HYPO|nr:hypothetical protein NLG97_g5459 [Lecanicillium saksenae]